MKKTHRIFLGVGVMLGLAMLTGCIEETFPLSDMATEEQVQESPSSTEAMALGMPAKAISIWDDASSHSFFGYPAQMIIRDMMTGDYCQSGAGIGYGWHFYYWAQNKQMGDGYRRAQFIWNFHWGFMLSVNNVIGAVNPENATDEQQGYLGAALAFRSLLYLDMARMYEFLPNDIFTKNDEGFDVTGLTVPWVDETTTSKQASNNPRLPRADMAAKILADLDKAEQYIGKLSSTQGQTLPDLACVYGLKARLYMWIEDYPNAQLYARKAIDETKSVPLTEAKALDTKAGYNTATDFMWALQPTSESECVQTGIVNWTSWASNQSTFGYTGPATDLYICIDKSMYERISDTDWRKKEWVAPAGSALDGQVAFTESAEMNFADFIPAYASVKFRPGSGNADDYNTGCCAATPIMRVEEMYFIEAEAAAHQSAAQGVTLVTNFMKQYRDPSYACTVSATDAVVEEIVFQKRVELWGEGQTFFDIKRLNMSVTRGYNGTNWQDTQSILNTNGRPAWMNYVMVRTEQNNNEALVNHNNPDPSDKYTPWTPSAE
ncbi:MAG: RagB/SusD family nutrient uptake outer membrane protein [Bacteroidaceae bacterium]|nr:RagB/SusD family nutrient uptake outer membrane protein [Bacteroidaceae bacterium]